VTADISPDHPMQKRGSRFLGCGCYSQKDHVVALRQHLAEMPVEMRLSSNGAKASCVSRRAPQICDSSYSSGRRERRTEIFTKHIRSSDARDTLKKEKKKKKRKKKKRVYKRLMNNEGLLPAQNMRKLVKLLAITQSTIA